MAKPLRFMAACTAKDAQFFPVIFILRDNRRQNVLQCLILAFSLPITCDGRQWCETYVSQRANKFNALGYFAVDQNEQRLEVQTN